MKAVVYCKIGLCLSTFLIGFTLFYFQGTFVVNAGRHKDTKIQRQTRHGFTRYQQFLYDSQGLSDVLNSNCRDNFAVPPIVHYVWLSKVHMRIHEYISMLSASKFLKPCYILIHGDVIPQGKWWRTLLTNVTNIIHVKHSPPTSIFGRTVKQVEHKSDIIRLEVLIKYGGIYLDTDTYVLQSFDPMRNNNLTMGQEMSDTVASSVIIATKNCPFLRIWYLTYHTFNDYSWADNSVKMAHKLAKLLPSMIKVKPPRMLVLWGGTFESVYEKNIDWGEKDFSVHLYFRRFPKKIFEIEDIKRLNNTFGALSRYILFGNRRPMYRSNVTKS